MPDTSKQNRYIVLILLQLKINNTKLKLYNITILQVKLDMGTIDNILFCYTIERNVFKATLPYSVSVDGCARFSATSHISNRTIVVTYLRLFTVIYWLIADVLI